MVRWEQRKSRRMADVPERESLRSLSAAALFFFFIAYVATIALIVSHP